MNEMKQELKSLSKDFEMVMGKTAIKRENKDWKEGLRADNSLVSTAKKGKRPSTGLKKQPK